MTRKVGVSPSSAPLRKSCVGGNSQLGASSIGSQAGSRSPPDPRRESDVRFDFYSLLVFFIQFFRLLPCAAARLPRPGRKTFACYFRRILCVVFLSVVCVVYPSVVCVVFPSVVCVVYFSVGDTVYPSLPPLFSATPSHFIIFQSNIHLCLCRNTSAQARLQIR